MTDRAVAAAQLATLLVQAAAVVREFADVERMVRTAIPDSMLGQDYPSVRRQYHDTTYAAVVGYLDSALPVTSYRTLMQRGALEAFPRAFYAGYVEASGGTEVDADDDKWLTGRTNQEVQFIADLFDTLKGLRGTVDANTEAAARADGYTATLDDICSQGRVRGDQAIMLTFKGQRGIKAPCPDCAKWDGKRHSAGFWLKRGLIGRNGNKAFECGRWDGGCQHHYYRDNGEMYAE